MQEVSDAGHTSLDASRIDASTGSERATRVAQPTSIRPYLRLIVRNPGPSRLRKRTASAPKAGGELAERLASRWATAFNDEEPSLADVPATSVRQVERPLAPIVPLFPHRRP